MLSAGCTHPAWRRGLGLRGGLRQLCSYLQPPQRYADLGLPQPDQGLQVELINLATSPPCHLTTHYITTPPLHHLYHLYHLFHLYHLTLTLTPTLI